MGKTKLNRCETDGVMNYRVEYETKSGGIKFDRVPADNILDLYKKMYTRPDFVRMRKFS